VDRAIVTSVAGTTRDTVEEVANLRGIPLHLIDTAGITPSNDPIEQIGIQRSRSAAESADIVLLVFDGSEQLSTQDLGVSEELRTMGYGGEDEAMYGQAGAKAPYRHNRTMIVVVNKADCPQRLEVVELQTIWPDVPMVSTSTLTGAGLPDLEETIANLVLAGKTLSSESALITSARHQEALRHAAENLRASSISLEQGLPLDFVSIDLRATYDALGEVTGETASDDLLDRIFSEFCIGK
jgi:tRNA modification GTPase